MSGPPQFFPALCLLPTTSSRRDHRAGSVLSQPKAVGRDANLHGRWMPANLAIRKQVLESLARFFAKLHTNLKPTFPNIVNPNNLAAMFSHENAHPIACGIGGSIAPRLELIQRREENRGSKKANQKTKNGRGDQQDDEPHYRNGVKPNAREQTDRAPGYAAHRRCDQNKIKRQVICKYHLRYCRGPRHHWTMISGEESLRKKSHPTQFDAGGSAGAKLQRSPAPSSHYSSLLRPSVPLRLGVHPRPMRINAKSAHKGAEPQRHSEEKLVVRGLDFAGMLPADLD